MQQGNGNPERRRWIGMSGRNRRAGYLRLCREERRWAGWLSDESGEEAHVRQTLIHDRWGAAMLELARCGVLRPSCQRYPVTVGTYRGWVDAVAVPGRRPCATGWTIAAIGFDRSQPLSVVVTLFHITERWAGGWLGTPGGSSQRRRGWLCGEHLVDRGACAGYRRLVGGGL